MTAALPLITLHSGGLGTRPNSLEFLEKARLAAPDIVEIDVRRTLDNAAVLNHDPWMKAGDENLILAEHTLHDLKAAVPLLLTLREAWNSAAGTISGSILISRRWRLRHRCLISSKKKTQG